jgi:hypothetical protein
MRPVAVGPAPELAPVAALDGAEIVHLHDPEAA